MSILTRGLKALCSLCILLPISLMANHKPQEIIIFGDSVSDTGVLKPLAFPLDRANIRNIPMNGLFSNGKQWIEFLAESLNLGAYAQPWTNAYPNGDASRDAVSAFGKRKVGPRDLKAANYAMGGARALNSSILLDLREQVSEHLKRLKSNHHSLITSKEKSLYVVAIGTNDLLNILDDVRKNPKFCPRHNPQFPLRCSPIDDNVTETILKTYKKSIDKLVNTISKNIARLYQSSQARRFLVLSAINLPQTPQIISYGLETQSKILTEYFNQSLSEDMLFFSEKPQKFLSRFLDDSSSSSQDITVQWLDHVDIWNHVFSNRDFYQIPNSFTASASCRWSLRLAALKKPASYCDANFPAADLRINLYGFLDGLHFTTPIHYLTSHFAALLLEKGKFELNLDGALQEKTPDRISVFFPK
ncbi:MAG: hypothetical protein HRU19_30465 [Pseudobacteriovorax sp.]|nr:hypothetical protein [Pseudobacteriovorax sp.]